MQNAAKNLSVKVLLLALLALSLNAVMFVHVVLIAAIGLSL